MVRGIAERSQRRPSRDRFLPTVARRMGSVILEEMKDQVFRKRHAVHLGDTGVRVVDVGFDLVHDPFRTFAYVSGDGLPVSAGYGNALASVWVAYSPVYAFLASHGNVSASLTAHMAGCHQAHIGNRLFCNQPDKTPQPGKNNV